jgi:kynurenine formamidase
MATEPKRYAESTTVQFLGRRLHILDLSHELSPTIPVYPGHMKVAFWDHMTHAESLLRLGDTPFRGYAVKGMSLCDHDSTHVDAIYHFNPDRPDLTIDSFPIDYCFTDAVWVDVSDVPPRAHITIERFRRAMDEAGVERMPEGGSVLYYTGAATRWARPLEFVRDFAGLDAQASRWILDQGVVNVLTDAVSTDVVTDTSYPNHTAHAEYLVNHTEIVNNIELIPRHSGFSLIVAPLRLMGCTGSPARIFALWDEG